MYNKSLVISGILIFLLIVLSPILYNSSATTAQLPVTSAANHPYPSDSTPSMDAWKVNHMKYVDATNIANCKMCHADTAEFCDKCHDFVGIRPSILD